MAGFKRYTIIIFFICCRYGIAAQIPYTVIAYHDVVNKKSELVGDAITAEELVNHFEWLSANGYTPVSLQAIIDAEKGVKPLPAKAVLLSFDDGYVSVYTKIFPLLKLYNYPAVVALVGAYLDNGVDSVAYGNAKKARTDFLSWDQIKEIKASGLVAFASHTYNLHNEVRSNKQGNTNPAAVTFIYDTILHQIETDEAFSKRIDRDFKANNNLFIKEFGELPSAIVWPYGRYNNLVRTIASTNGLPISINLNTFANYGTELHFNINRFYITRNATADALRDYVENNQRIYYYRSLQVPVNSFKDAITDKEETVFNEFINTIATTTANAIIIPVLYKEGDSLFTLFKNTVVPWKNTQLNRVVWQSQSRIQTDVYLLWDEKLIKEKELNDDQWVSFFTAMGRVAPARGVVIHSDNVIRYLKKETALSYPKEKNNSLLRRNRTRLVSNDSLQTPPMFYYLQAFQHYQVDVSAILQLSNNDVQLVNDTNFLRHVFAYFNAIIIDLTTCNKTETLRFLKQMADYPEAFSRMAIQLPLLSEADFKSIEPILIQKKLVSYGFKIETLKELQMHKPPVNTRKVEKE